jgi:hypothetical protein
MLNISIVKMQISEAINKAVKGDLISSIHAYYQGSQDPSWSSVLKEKIQDMSIEELRTLELELIREARNRDGISVFMGNRKPGDPGIVQEMLRSLIPNHVFT